MIETYKLLHDKYYGEYSQLVKLHASPISREGTRGHSFKLCQEGSKLNFSLLTHEADLQQSLFLWINIPLLTSVVYSQHWFSTT